MKNIEKYGLLSKKVNWNLTPDELEKITLEKGMGKLSDAGALAINTGEFTGRSPKDRFIVKDSITADSIWWDGNINIPFDSAKFDKLYDKVISYLSEKEVYIRDGYVCADDRYRVNIRTINELPWSNLFVYNMFLRPKASELENFSEDWLIVNAPNFKAEASVDGTRQHNFAILNFEKKIALIGGTGYTGEQKKGIFSALNFILPVDRNVFPMHCSSNVGKDGDTAIFFGLSGTGKTTLSADPNRRLIGDDEHGWTSDNKVFNFEGGCYAKVVDLTEEKEPDIFNAIKKGALLENVVFKDGSNEVDFEKTDITPNTRVSYPIDFIDNIQPGSVGGDPKNIFFLTYDAFGVLPPISKLNPNQAAYHFISGYTSKVAGTEAGVTEPQTTFSACFGAPFMPLHPAKYGEMLSKKISESGVNVWLVNTGIVGGAYGVGERMSLKHTRSIITGALDGSLNNVSFEEHPIFKVQIPKECNGVPSELLNPRDAWSNGNDYDTQARKLSAKFHENFKQFEEYANDKIMSGAPVI